MTKSTGLLVAVWLGVASLAAAKADPQCDLFMPNYKTKSNVDCKYYLQCEEGVLTTKSCPWLQKFDPAKATCKLGGVDCNANPAPLPKPWPAFDCTGRPDFKTTSPWGCKHYLQCSGGLLSAQSCSIWLPKFQPSTQECRALVYNVCDQRPFPPPDPTTTAGPTTTSEPTGPTPSGPTPSEETSTTPSDEGTSTTEQGPTPSDQTSTPAGQSPTPSDQTSTPAEQNPTPSVQETPTQETPKTTKPATTTNTTTSKPATTTNTTTSKPATTTNTTTSKPATTTNTTTSKPATTTDTTTSEPTTEQTFADDL